MTTWLPKRTIQESRDLRDTLSKAEQSELTVRMMNAVPPVSELYAERHCPSVLKKVRRYNAERARACCAEDLDKLAHIRHEIEQEAVVAMLPEDAHVSR